MLIQGYWFSLNGGVSQIILSLEPNNWLSLVMWQWLLICMGKVKSPLIQQRLVR